MRSMRRAAVRLTGALLLVAMLLVPLAASAHTHRDLQAARSCATCVAAHHSPAIVMPAAAGGPPIAPAITAALPSRVDPAPQHRSPRAGRAPPSSAPVSVA
jgi:ABC-type Mn2+/Zn2+ transport system permease subunit